MAILRELVAMCEAQRLDSGPTLTVFARRLREAGRISKAGRGRGAAQMTYLDAARFLIACAATDHPEQAVDAEYVFSGLVRVEDFIADSDFPLPAKKFPTLDAALAEVLRCIGEGEADTVNAARFRQDFPDSAIPMRPLISWLILRRNGGGAELRLLDGRYIYRHPALVAVTDTLEKGGGGHLATKLASEALDRETFRFRTAKNLMAELDATLLRAVAQLIAGKAQ